MYKYTNKIVIAICMISVFFTGYTSHIIKTDSFKDEFLERINDVRQKGCKCGNVYMPPVPPLVWNNQLTDAAKDHARDMSKRKYFSHTSKDGRSIQDRIMATGYNYTCYKSFAIGENIAQGQESIAEVSDGWFESPGHCKNLMNPSFKEIGIAEYNRYWVQDFGGRIEFSEQEQKMIKSGRLIIKRRIGHE
jgi:uncharacterized protein YkwD